MALSKDQDKQLAILIDHEEDLNEFAHEFMESLMKQKDRYGERCNLSEKQAAKLEQLAEQYDK